MEINGFEVDEFNVYNIDTKAKLSTCPKCSHTRKKKTQKCLMLDWERGLGTCQHCGDVVQLHTYKKASTGVSYAMPPKKEKKQVLSQVAEYFQKRGISNDTIETFGVTNGEEFMPQVGQEVNVIMFNYYVGQEIINIKYRDARKNFKMYKGAQKPFTTSIQSLVKTLV